MLSFKGMRFISAPQLWTNNKVCHKVPNGSDRIGPAVLAITVCHKSSVNSCLSVVC